MDSKIKTLQDKIAEAHLGGGIKRIEKQHEKKKLTARERVLYLLDEGSFEEMGDFILFNTWHDVAYWFSGLSVVSIILMRLLFKLRKKKNIVVNNINKLKLVLKN